MCFLGLNRWEDDPAGRPERRPRESRVSGR